MLRDNGSDSYNSSWRHGGARWFSCTGFGDKEGGEVGGAPPLELEVLVLLSPPTRT